MTTGNSMALGGAAPGDVIAGRFRVTGVVGKGAMGAVYAAEHTSTGQQVALKFMIVEGEEGSEFVVRFEQEARIMAGLKHPNTIRIYDFGRTDEGAMFMAMELLEGQGLDRAIRENTRIGTTMEESQAVDCGIQILKSLEEAHRQGLVHRDLKPGNVFLTDDGGGELLCKVLDFGIARVSDSEMTNAGRLLGTPSYMSPEQWQGSRVDARSDLYAVGCILHACVTGAPPFTTDGNALTLMNKHLHLAPPDPRDRCAHRLSDDFCDVVATALAKTPDARYADARSMRLALQAVAGGAWAGTPSGLGLGTPTNLTRPGAATNRVMPSRDSSEVHAGRTVALDLASDGVSAFDATLPSQSMVASRAGGSRAVILAAVALAIAVGAFFAWRATTTSAPPTVATPTAGSAGMPNAASAAALPPVAAIPTPAPEAEPIPPTPAPSAEPSAVVPAVEAANAAAAPVPPSEQAAEPEVLPMAAPPAVETAEPEPQAVERKPVERVVKPVAEPTKQRKPSAKEKKNDTGLQFVD